MSKNMRVAIFGYGNVGKHAATAVAAAPDMTLCGIVDPFALDQPAPGGVPIVPSVDLLENVDIAILCTPSRSVLTCAVPLLEQGISTVDSFDIHPEIVDLRAALDIAAKRGGTRAVVSAGWDPGSDSVIRTLLEAAAPVGITYTDFGPGMSMGHSVAARSIYGVRDALSLTIPLGTGLHRRVLYIEIEDGANYDDVCAAIKNDNYFRHDELHIIPVADVSALADRGHGVHMARRGRSSGIDNQLFTFEMRIHNPALTAQIMTSCARACTRVKPGAYTLIEIPLIDLLPGDREEIINRLV